MAKKIVLLIVILTMLISFSVAVSCEELSEASLIENETFEEGGGTEWYRPENIKFFIQENIVPWVSVVVTAIASIYIAISPVLMKIKKSSGIFDNATEKLKEAKAVAEAAKSQLKEAESEITALKGEFKEVKDGYLKMINGISNIEQIVRLGFGNTDELIVKGYANKIEKVGNVNGEEKEI